MKRQRELEAKYEAQWDAGKGSHHPDYDPAATGDDVVSRAPIASPPFRPPIAHARRGRRARFLGAHAPR